MLKEHESLIATLNEVTDILLTTGSFFLAYRITKALSHHFTFFSDLGSLSTYLWMILIIVPAWKISLTTFKVYDTQRTVTIYQYILRILQALFLGGLICASAVFIFQRYTFSRGLFFVFLSVNFVTLVAWKLPC